MDFVRHQPATGRKLGISTIAGTWSRFSPVIDPRHSYRGEDTTQIHLGKAAKLSHKWSPPRSKPVDLLTGHAIFFRNRLAGIINRDRSAETDFTPVTGNA